MFRGAVRILVIITYPFELHGNSRVVIEDGRLGISLADDQGIRIEEILVILVLRDIAHICLGEEPVVETEFELPGVSN